MSDPTLTDVMAGIQSLILTLTQAGTANKEIRLAPNSIPDAIDQFPAVMTYPFTGEVSMQAYGQGLELHTMAVDLMMSAALFRHAYSEGTRLLGLILRLLEKNPTLGGTIQTYSRITYNFEGKVMLTPQVAALMWRIKIEGCKIQPTWTS